MTIKRTTAIEHQLNTSTRQYKMLVICLLRPWNWLILLGVLCTCTPMADYRKVLVTRIRFGTVSNDLYDNVTAVLERQSKPVHGLSAWSPDEGNDIQSSAEDTDKATENNKDYGYKYFGKLPSRKYKQKDTKYGFGRDRKMKGAGSLMAVFLEHNAVQPKKGISPNKGSSWFPKTVAPDVEDNPEYTSSAGPLPRIVGGSQSSPNGWPSEASIQYLGQDGYWYHFCGGSLIHSQWVVTVAHCLVELEDYILRVVLGDYRLGSFDGREQIISPSNIFEHTSFNRPLWNYDLGMIKLEYPATLNRYVQIAELATEAMEPFNKNHECYVAGWGSIQGHEDEFVTPDYLQQTQMTVITKQECKHQLQISDVLVDSHICVENDISSVCIGDSGSPLQCLYEDQWVLVGLASWIRDDGCEPSVPNVFTRMSSYNEWCYSVMNMY